MADEYEQKIPTPEQTTPTPETKTPTPIEGNDFQKITEFISQEGLEEKKDLINKVLSDNKIKQGFENFLKTANPRIKLKIKKDLLNCKTEEEVKSIIVENLPGYKIGEENNREDGDKPGNETKPEENGDLLAEVDNKEEDKQQAEEDKQQAEEDKQQAEEKEEKASAKENLLKAIDYRQKLMESHPGSNLDVKTGPESDLYKETKKQLEENGIINKLKQDKHDDEFINNYILVQATLQEVKHNTNEYSQDEISTFDKIVKNLNNACNIPDTNLNSFSDENISKTRTELFHDEIGNKSLIEAKESNMKSKSHEKAYTEIFPQMEDEELFKKYGKFLEGDSKLFLLQYQTNPDIRNKIADAKKNPTEENKQLLENYDRMYVEALKIKDDYDVKTRDTIEELCIISQIKGMYMCMGKGDNFDLNKSREIRYDEKGAMILDGHIDGVAFSIRQDINNPEARLQTSQKLAMSSDGNTFSIGGKDNFVDSNFVLPSQNEVFAAITETVKTDKSLDDADNQNDYLKNLQENIMGKVEEKYYDTEYVHHYMQGQVIGEKIVDDTLKFIGEVKPDIINNATLMESINKETNKDLYEFLKILKFNIDNSTNVEKDKFNRCINEIGRIINDYKSNKESSGFYSDEISKHLENDTRINGTEDDRLKHFFDLFNDFNKNPTDKSKEGFSNDGISSYMIINDLYMQLHDKPNQKRQEKERENKTNADKDEADNILENNGDLRPPENVLEKPSMA